MVESDRVKSRQDAFKQILRMNKEINFFEEALKDQSILSNFLNTTAQFDLGFSTKYAVHFSLYGKTIMALGTQKHRGFIENAYKFNDIGCFALTELRHGSNARGIQTRADFDPKTREFVINTPENSDMKVWIGAAGHLANMSTVWA
mmetsp:Transcript_25758/g.22736  ORF Transcript_25758/g.22736 Transcript_25758/m.22736 type:complete len:146 (-) Transcript_25758:836-1273(-)